MENKEIKTSTPKVFDCGDGHKILLFKGMFGSRRNQCECWCLACGNSLIVDLKNKDNLNIIYTNKDTLSLLNSMNSLKEEFLINYYENKENIKEAVIKMNENYSEEKPKVLTKNKTTM